MTDEAGIGVAREREDGMPREVGWEAATEQVGICSSKDICSQKRRGLGLKGKTKSKKKQS